MNDPATITDYLVSYGERGDFARFRPENPLVCRRGDRVIVRTDRGLELGTVLRDTPSSLPEMLPSNTVGDLVRVCTPADELDNLRIQATASELLVHCGDAPAPVLDVEVLFDGKSAIVHTLGGDPIEMREYVRALSPNTELVVIIEDVGAPTTIEEPAPTCGKEGCGSGDCGSCGSGGCDTCGSKSTDLQAYFQQLRQEMESSRVPLI